MSRAAHVSVAAELIDPVTGGLAVPWYGTIPPFRHTRTDRGLIVWRRSRTGRRRSPPSSGPTRSRAPSGGRTRDHVGELERARYRAVLLDEYQDTGHAQRVLLRALFGQNAAATAGVTLPVTAVGDPVSRSTAGDVRVALLPDVRAELAWVADASAVA